MRSIWIISPIIAIGLATSAPAQQAAKDLIGTWALVSVTAQEPGGPITNDFGAQPQGRLNFDANGNYSLIVIASDLPKFASNNRMTGTTNEDDAVVKGSIAHFGHYTVGDGDINFKIDYSTFPNWNGNQQQRHFTIGGNKLTYDFIPPGSKATVTVVWQQMK
jgi:hypothetical protein